MSRAEANDKFYRRKILDAILCRRAAFGYGCVGAKCFV